MPTNKLRVLRDVRNKTEQLAKEMTDSAAKHGLELVTKITVFPVSDFPGWATTLATALCEDPELAKEPNHKLAAIIEAKVGKKGFNPKVISKKLSAAQQAYAADILRQHGYRVTDLLKGTDIKRIVLDGVAPETAGKDSATVFHADGVSIDGKLYKYRQRNVTPTSTPWHDLCIRIGGVEIPLQTVLTLRNVSISEFQLKDAAAKEFARTEQTVRRQDLDREPRMSRSVAQLAKVVKELNDSRAASEEVVFFTNRVAVTGNAVGTPNGVAANMPTIEEEGAYIDNGDGTLRPLPSCFTARAALFSPKAA